MQIQGLFFSPNFVSQENTQLVNKYGSQSGKANLYVTLFHLLQLGGCGMQDTNIILAFNSAWWYFPSLICTGALQVHESFLAQ